MRPDLASATEPKSNTPLLLALLFFALQPFLFDFRCFTLAFLLLLGCALLDAVHRITCAVPIR